ncbi:MAG: hypothetical protein ACI87A_001950 [Planctomycetota bacterium]|jgi:hypothetical protein
MRGLIPAILKASTNPLLNVLESLANSIKQLEDEIANLSDKYFSLPKMRNTESKPGSTCVLAN